MSWACVVTTFNDIEGFATDRGELIVRHPPADRSALCCSGAALAPAGAAEPSAVGLWEQVDENSGKAESWFRIIEHNGVYEGTIVKMFFKPGEEPRIAAARNAKARNGARRCSA